jgi:choline dehydrogenase-like flavoprotein
MNIGIRLYPLLRERSEGLAKDLARTISKWICETDTGWYLTKRDWLHLVCHRAVPAQAGRLVTVSEQAPNRASRVLLSEERDRFGLKRANLDWNISAIDKRTIRQAGLSVGKYFAGANLGRVKLYNWLFDDSLWMPGQDDGEEAVGYHHMGTTRMGHTPKDGVVDKNCQVFGIQNLYLSGSSVFTTSGHANPTFSIVQLALRLAAYLSAR